MDRKGASTIDVREFNAIADWPLSCADAFIEYWTGIALRRNL
jgi:hypothetical protein